MFTASITEDGWRNRSIANFCAIVIILQAQTHDKEQQMTLQYRIEGTTLPVLTVTLTPGDKIYSSSGGMSWMTQQIQMETNSGGGLGKMFKRALSGESIFVVDYFVNSGQGEVAFSAEFPGKILTLNLADNQSMIVQKDAFMCAEKGVDLDMHFRKRLGAGLFGGEGFILQRLTGPGHAFVNLDGEIVEKTLQPGEVLRVDTGHVAMFEPTIDFDIEMVRGFKNILLGGEGLFLGTLRGPGRVWLQTMPMGKLAQKIAQYMPQVGGQGQSGGGNINLGQLLGGN
jgi:uncharacterized protein (TIGR00266 family)